MPLQVCVDPEVVAQGMTDPKAQIDFLLRRRDVRPLLLTTLREFLRAQRPVSVFTYAFTTINRAYAAALREAPRRPPTMRPAISPLTSNSSDADGTTQLQEVAGAVWLGLDNGGPPPSLAQAAAVNWEVYCPSAVQEEPPECTEPYRSVMEVCRCVSGVGEAEGNVLWAMRYFGRVALDGMARPRTGYGGCALRSVGHLVATHTY